MGGAIIGWLFVAVVVGIAVTDLPVGGSRFPVLLLIVVPPVLPDGLVRFSHNFKLALLELRCNRMGMFVVCTYCSALLV